MAAEASTPFTDADYLGELKEILRKLVSPDKKLLQTAWIQPLRKVMKDLYAFRHFLETRQLAKYRFEFELEEIPDDILVWLLRVACSADTDVCPPSITTTDNCVDHDKAKSKQKDNAKIEPVRIRDGAMETLKALLESNKVLAKKLGWCGPTNNSDENDLECDDKVKSDREEDIYIPKPAFLSLDQLVVQLLAWVPLTGASTNTRENTDPATGNTKHLDKINPRGLVRLLSIWYTAFKTDQVSVSKGLEGENDATQCLVLLIKLGLDNRLRSTDR